MSAHAKLGPSGADRWMVCAGSPAAEEGLPDDVSEFAAEGTFAHQISEECLAFGLDPFDFIGHRLVVEGYSFEWSEDDAEQLAFGITQVRDFGGQFFGEHRVDLTHWLGPDQFGTLDRGIKLPDLIVIDDLKWGRGLPVSPIENKQLMLYGLGFWHAHARETHKDPNTRILLIVDQPRCSGGGGEWETTLGRLIEFGEEARAAAERTRDPNAARTASEKGCMFCKRRTAPGGCETFDEFMLDLVGSKFESLDDDIAICAPPYLPLTGMTPDRRAHILRHRKLFENWLETLHDQHLDDCIRGLPGGGLKAVEGRKSPDKWFDKQKADDALLPLLGDDRFNPKLKTPTQALKEIDEAGKAAIDPLIDRGTKKPVLVGEQDARPAVLTLEQKFEDVEMENENG